MDKYGGKCACCGESELDFLTIDHIYNDGNEHRKKFNIGPGKETYRWLRRNDYPDGFQVLCFNCNLGKRINKGICPHKRR